MKTKQIFSNQHLSLQKQSKFSWGAVAVLGLDSVIILQQNGSTEDVRCKIIENVFV